MKKKFSPMSNPQNFVLTIKKIDQFYFVIIIL